MVKIQEAENQIIVEFEVYAKRPNDSDPLIPAIEIHEKLLKRTPEVGANQTAAVSSGPGAGSAYLPQGPAGLYDSRVNLSF